MMKEDTFQSRRDAARDAKTKLLERFRNASADPDAERRKAERAAVVAAREERMRVKAEQERIAAEARRAEEERVAAEEKARKEAEEAVRIAAQPRIQKTQAYALATRALADMAKRQNGQNRKIA